MTELDEEWIDWASGTAGIAPEAARGLLAGFYTMRAKHYPLAIEHIQGSVKAGEASLAELPRYVKRYPIEAEADRAMWEALLPQLAAMAR